MKPVDAVCRHVLIARAVENRMFVASVNNPAAPQELTSIAVSPFGVVLAEVPRQMEGVATVRLEVPRNGAKVPNPS